MDRLHEEDKIRFGVADPQSTEARGLETTHLGLTPSPGRATPTSPRTRRSVRTKSAMQVDICSLHI
jgi:hypothetical protein